MVYTIYIIIYIYTYRVFALMCSHNQLPNASSPLAHTAHTTTTTTNSTNTALYNKPILQPSQSYIYTQNPANITTILNNSTHHNIHTNSTTNNNNTNKSSIYEAPSTFCSLLGRYLTSSHREINDYGSFKTTTTTEEEEKRLSFRIQVSIIHAAEYNTCSYSINLRLLLSDSHY